MSVFMRRTWSRIRYFRLTGTITYWFIALFVLFASWALYVRASGETPRLTPYLLTFLFPLAAGTGLLTSAQSGHFDLLLGSGEKRKHLWWTALSVAWLLPSLLVVTLFVLSVGGDRLDLYWRLAGLLVFAGGIAFAVGLRETRYVVGVIWLLSRLAVVMMIGAMERTVMFRADDLPSAPILGAMVLAAPELLLERSMPAQWIVFASVLGVFALFVSYAWFARADFGAKRT